MIDATPLLRLYARYRNLQLAGLRAPLTQERQLKALLRRARGTKIGRQYDFASINTVEQYQARVPLRSYDAFWNEFWKEKFPYFENITWPGRIRYIPVSSGTSTGATKWIPCSAEMIRSNTKAGLDLLVHHLNARPHSRVFGGKSFILGGSTDLVERARSIYSGDLSGIAVKTLPWWARLRYFPPAKIALLKDWEQKIDILARRSLAEDIRTLSGVPNWLLILFNKLRELRPDSGALVRNLYPNLEMLVHGGVNFAPYRQQFEEILEGSRAELREVYPASEGFIAIADRAYGDGLRLNLDHGLFYEFIPVAELESKFPTRHWVKNIEPDVNYAVAITSCAGLWSYLIGDTVKFVDTKAPRLLVTGRTSYYISAFGEHLIGEEIEDAVAAAALASGTTVSDFSMGAVYPAAPSELGGHLYVVEFGGGIPSPEALAKFAETLDARLITRNEDYEAHRQKGFGMKAPSLQAVKPGFFAAWMKSRGKLGGQNKVPRIIIKQELLDDLRSFAAQHG